MPRPSEQDPPRRFDVAVIIATSARLQGEPDCACAARQSSSASRTRPASLPAPTGFVGLDQRWWEITRPS